MKKFLVIALFIFIAASFITLPRNPLLNDDASTYALSTKNAIIYNQWLVQFLTPGDISSFLDKPPLGIWLLSIIPKMAGINELTIHIPNVFYYCIFLLLLYVSLSRLASKKIALSSTLIAATSLALIVYSRAPKLDVLLTLFVLAAHLSLYSFLKDEKPTHLYLFSFMLALGFLVKSAFGILIPGLTVLALFMFNSLARKKLLKFLFSFHSVFCALIFLLIAGGIIGAQCLSLGDYWLPYLKSITVQAKYNISSIGLGFHHAVIGLFLITIFPWSPLFLSSLKLNKFRFKTKLLNLNTFCNYWFLSNFLFLIFLYPPMDFRHCTPFVTPLAILAGIRLISLAHFPNKRRTSLILWSIFFLFIFSAILIAWFINPVNPEGIDVKATLIPIFLFVISLAIISIYFWKPSALKFYAAFVMTCISYSVLFYYTLPIANAFNPDIEWPGMITEYREKGYEFYIYRPPDRKLFMSPDLFYVDFISGPADQYFWDGKRLTRKLYSGKAIILSDTQSWKKLNLKKGKIIAQDSYSSLILR
jgi:4-amino-4-deoxy-L-arabinose transferase-like glycosyltransferase